MVPPSGRQFRIRRGGQAATIAEVGGGVREYAVDNRAVLDGYAENEMATAGRGQPLLPWPNRIRDGRYTFNGHEQQLPITEVERNNAIHGLTRWQNWTPVELSESRVTMMLALHPQPGYPYSLLLAIEYALSEDGLTVRTRARNMGDQVLPFGAGFHPYLWAGGALVDGVDLEVPARRRLEMDERQLPTGATLEVEGTELDYRRARPVGSTHLDTCYTELERGSGGRTSIRFGKAELWVDAAHSWVMVFSGDNLAPERRRRGLAVEPMTCPPDAFNSGTGLMELKPAEAVELSWGIVA